MREKKFVSVFTPPVARGLLQAGYKLHDMKPMKEDPDRSIYIFVNENNIRGAINRISTYGSKLPED